MTIFCKIGDCVGYIQKYKAPNEADWKWRLVETTVDRISLCKDGVHIYTKRFRPLYDEEIESNTRIMRENTGIILTAEPFLLDDTTRAKAERWVSWINENPENEKIASFKEEE